MLRDRTEEEEPLLHGVNLKTEPTKLKLGYFTNLQNWIPAKRYKLKKKRGPVTFVGQGTPLGGVVTPSSCVPLSLAASGDMDCHSGASVTLTASGGVAPYSWETTKGTLSSTTGAVVTLTPPTNSGSSFQPGVIAYGIAVKYIVTFCACRSSHWDCGGNQVQDCLAINSAGCWGNTCSCSNCAQAADAVCDLNGAGQCSKPACPDSDPCVTLESLHKFCDERTQEQIDNSCNPCAISMQGGAVVTVTDSLGQSAFVTIDTIPATTI